MTIAELKIQFDLNPDNRVGVLKNIDTCRLTRYGYFFVDQEDGQCYLFDEDGNLDDIHKVKRIEYGLFAYCEFLTNIKIPNSVESIENWAFADCASLKSIKISDFVESIWRWAFLNCTSLTNIDIPRSVKQIGINAFAYCTSLKEIVFEGKTIDQVKAIDWYPWGIKDESIIKCLG